MVKEDLFAFGVNYPKIHYDNFLDWFVQTGSFEHHWKHQPTYILSQGVFLFGGLATFIHAILSKGRLPYLWLGVLLHGLVVECMSYAAPDIDNFWHSQTPIMFLGRRLPLHILMLYPCFIYQATVGINKLKLPRWAEPFAVGLCVVLIDIPYDIISVNYLHWTWHDTDPNIYDRHYWVPWNSYYFHACFAASFTFWFHFTRKKICNTTGWTADIWWKELVCTFIAALLGTPGGILLFIPIYHPLHDIYKLHSEVTFFILFTIFLLIIWSGDRIARVTYGITKPKINCQTFILLLHLVLHYACFLVITVFFNAEDEIAIGLKEPVGNCKEEVPVQTVFGLVLKKKKYLCSTEYDEKYFDWSCLKEPPKEGSIWYTACGVALPNRAEMIAIISLICLMASVIFWNLHFKSFGDEVFVSKKLIKRDAAKKRK